MLLHFQRALEMTFESHTRPAPAGDPAGSDRFESASELLIRAAANRKGHWHGHRDRDGPIPVVTVTGTDDKS